MNPSIKRNLVWITIVCLLILVGGLFAFHEFSRSTDARAPDDSVADSYRLKEPGVIEADDTAIKTADIRTSTVRSQDLPVTLTLTGRTGLDMEDVTHVHAQFGGKVKEVKPDLAILCKAPARSLAPPC